MAIRLAAKMPQACETVLTALMNPSIATWLFAFGA